MSYHIGYLSDVKDGLLLVARAIQNHNAIALMRFGIESGCTPEKALEMLKNVRQKLRDVEKELH